MPHGDCVWEGGDNPKSRRVAGAGVRLSHANSVRILHINAFERIRNDVIGDRRAELPGINIGEAEMNAAKNSCVHNFIES